MRALIFICVLMLAGCATKDIQIPAMPVSNLEQSNQILIEDLRPDSETKAENFSLLVTSKAYGIYRSAEFNTNPTGPRLIAHRAYEKFPRLNDETPIKIHHFVTYSNLQSYLRKQSAGIAFFGVAGGLLANSTKNTPSEISLKRIDNEFLQQTQKREHERAFYSKEENPNKSPLNIIYIETELFEQKIASRCVVPPLLDKPHATLTEVADICITHHLDLYSTPLNR